jgi:hypothetical protein
MKAKKANLVLLLTSIFSSLVLSEVILRLFVPQETKRLAVFDEDLGWRGTPGGEGVYIRVRDNIRVPFKYNSAGFRDEEFPDVESDLQQIVVLGDSFVESLEVEYERTFHRLMESSFSAGGDRPAAVVNISSQGYSTAQEILAYRKFRGALNPDVVLLSFYTGNDFGDNLREAFARIDDEGTVTFTKQDVSRLQIGWLTFQRWLYENSHLVFFGKNLVSNLFKAKLGPETKSETRVSEDQTRETTARLILRLHEEVAADGVRFGVLIFPSKKELAAGDLTKSAFVEKVCREAGIASLRLDAVLSGEHFFQYDEHLNEEGHRVAAEQIMMFLKSSLAGVNPGDHRVG